MNLEDKEKIMNIAIIDSGIDVRHPRLNNCSIKGIFITPEDNGQFSYKDSFNDTIGHGTAIAGIIHKHIPQATLWAVKIFDNTLTSKESVLTEAIKWCLENDDISIINLSLGILTDNPSLELSEICKKVYEHNKILISSRHIDPKLVSYPANYPYVFPVNSGNTNKEREYGIATNPNNAIEFLAKGTIQRVFWKNQEFNIVTGTSYACAHFTGIVADHLQKNNQLETIDQIKQTLIKGACPDIKNTHQIIKIKTNDIPVIQPEIMDKRGKQLFSTKKMKWIGQFAIFPSSEKEMTTLISLLHSRKNDLIYSIDYPRSINIDKNTKLSRILNDDEWNNIDTLIVGYFYDHLFEANVRFGCELVNQAIIKNKNIFAYDKQLLQYIDTNLLKTYQGKLYFPVIDAKSFNEIIKFEHLPSIKAPVVAVIGTTNRQGKFSTQVRLKEIMEQDGYSVSMLSTEPHGELLGSTFAFPYGFSSTVNISRSQWKLCVKTIIKGISYYENPHIILTGTQGCLLPRKNASTGNETCSFDFLLGVEPDCLLCVINPEDTIEDINDTIKLAKLLTNVDVLLFALSPWERNYQVIDGKTYSDHHFLNGNEYEEKKFFFKDQLGKEVINIMDDQDMQKTLQIIENFFS